MFLYKSNTALCRKFHSPKILLSIFLLIIIFNSHAAYAQNQQVRFTRLSVEEGLAPGNVNDIIQDSLGFIWIGTQSGLCRYDGYNFVLYNNKTSDSNSISHNHVFSLLKGNNGILWVGTLGGGLNKFDVSTGKFKRYMHDDKNPESISNDLVFKLFVDSKNRFWISTLGGGLNLFDPEREIFKHYTHNPQDSNSISSNMITALYEDSNNNFWVGSFDNGFSLFSPEENRFTHFKNNPKDKSSISHNKIMDFLEDDKGRFWIATFGGGVNLFDADKNQFNNYLNDNTFPLEVGHPNIRKLYENSNNIFVGTYNGLFKFDKETFEKTEFFSDQKDPNTLNNNKIRTIFQDRNEVLWVGTVEGANKYFSKQKNFELYSYDTIDKNFVKDRHKIPSFIKNKNIIWPGLNNFFNKYNVKESRIIKFYGGKNDAWGNRVSISKNFYEDERGVLWFASYDGLKYFNKKNGEFVNVQYKDDGTSTLGNNFIKCFYIDRQNNFWAGSLAGGLSYFNPTSKSFKRYVATDTAPGAITDSRVMAILEDSFGLLWIGTYGGLNVFDRENDSFNHYIVSTGDSTGISNDRIYSIYESKSGDLWIGTYQGLNKFNRGKDNFEHFTVADGLADNTIFGILEDDTGCLWMRTNKGISKFDPHTKIFKNYDSRDGLKGMELNGSVYFKSKDGKMFFGGANGFNAFYPSEILDNPHAPEAVFSNLKIMGKEVIMSEDSPLNKPLNEIDELVLSYKDEIISFEIAALDYAIPSKNQFAYQLQGYRDEWNYINADNRMVTFTKLNHGEYTLRIKASNNDGIWNEVGRSLKIIITPPYWETWWFRISAFAFLLLIIFLFYEYRLHRLLEVERTRTRIASNLHDEVGSSLSSIQYFAKAISKESKNNHPENKEKFINLIIESSADAQDKIKDIIWTVNPDEDGLEKFIIKFNRYASDLLDSHDINYNIDFPRGNLNKIMPMDKRQHLWCICKETLTNTIKHSQCNNVNISFDLNGKILEYSIEDDGVGFDKNNDSSGNGITNISKRAEILSAKYQLETSKGKGTNWHFSFKI